MSRICWPTSCISFCNSLPRNRKISPGQEPDEGTKEEEVGVLDLCRATDLVCERILAAEPLHLLYKPAWVRVTSGLEIDFRS
jgi:hypothetical protein